VELRWSYHLEREHPMARVKINTSDIDWIKGHAPESEVIPYGTDIKGVMYFQAEVKVWSVEHVKFAGAKMIRFEFASGSPSDHAKSAMYPESYLIND
jgi:hypothetical protein